jgi:hypothetical protein
MAQVISDCRAALESAQKWAAKHHVSSPNRIRGYALVTLENSYGDSRPAPRPPNSRAAPLEHDPERYITGDLAEFIEH